MHFRQRPPCLSDEVTPWNRRPGKPVKIVVRFINGLKADGEVTIDVNNLQPKALTLMELTKDQREKVQR